VQILHDIIICEETAPECLPNVCTEPNIMQIPASLNSKEGLLKCVVLKVLIFNFQMSPSDISLNVFMLLTNLNVLLVNHQAELEHNMDRTMNAQHKEFI
jgi:hypothetical protein